MPLTYTLDGKEYTDTEDHDISDLPSKMKASKQAPKTACPSIETIAEKVRNSEGSQVFIITVSAGISGTYNAARLAGEQIAAENTGKKVCVVDSMTASAGIVRIVLKFASFLKKTDLGFDEICEKLHEIRSRNRTRFLLNDLGTLVKSGRMSKVLGIITSVIPLKLICGDNGAGEIRKYTQVLGMKKGIASLSEFPAANLPSATGNLSKEEISAIAPREKDDLITISHCNNTEGAGILKTLLEKFGFSNILTFLTRGISTFYASDKGIVVAY